MFIVALSFLTPVGEACSNILVTKGASTSGTLIGYNADSISLFGELYHFPAAKHEQGEMRKIIDWDSLVHVMDIPEAEETYNVIGNQNEYQLAIGETTFGGLKSLTGYPSGIDYGNLIWITLQRSKDAREALKSMTNLVATYGYYSSGESFSIADGNEVWILEMVGRGKDIKGALWVALRVPDGYVAAHSNQARITQFIGKFNCKTEIDNDKDSDCFYVEDVVEFAKEHDLVFKDVKKEDFSFSDVYCPLNFSGVRAAEARTWSFFTKLTSKDEMAPYISYVLGKDYKNRMPLWVKPHDPVSVEQVQLLLGDHFEGTILDFSTDVGAGPSEDPYRWRPLFWKASKHEGKEYFNERSAGTQQTGWTFVAESRKNLKDHIGGRIWWGPDDAATCPYVPFYAANTAIPRSYGKANVQGRSVLDYDENNIFWVVNLVANWAYTRYDLMYPIILEKKAIWHESISQKMDEIEGHVSSLPKDKAVEELTKFSNQNAETLLVEWKELFGFLFARFRDWYVIEKNPNREEPLPKVTNPGYDNDWYNRIVDETGDRYLMPSGEEQEKFPLLADRTGL